jgi:hypothetical protein
MVALILVPTGLALADLESFGLRSSFSGGVTLIAWQTTPAVLLVIGAHLVFSLEDGLINTPADGSCSSEFVSSEN